MKVEMPTAAASRRRSLGSLVSTASPRRDASATTAASTTSEILAFPHSSPHAFASASSSGSILPPPRPHPGKLRVGDGAVFDLPVPHELARFLELEAVLDGISNECRQALSGISNGCKLNDMDAYLTTGQVARALSTTIPRIHRAAKAGLVRSRRLGNGRLALPASAPRTLRRRWGWVPSIRGVGREEAFVLAALSRRPLGLRSVRAVARASGLSPTAAADALRLLGERGYVEQRSVRIAEGRARDATVWSVRWRSSAWRRVASQIGLCELPLSRSRPRRSHRVPRRLAHLFWNVKVDELDTRRDARYIADRMLRNGDSQGLAWLADSVPREAIAEAARGRGLDPRRAALGRVLAAAT